MKVNKIIIHCSATKEGVDFKASDIDRWHKERGFKNIGYHYVIDLNGTVETGRSETTMGAHCKGQNCNSLGICYIGGLDSNGKAKDTRTDKQKQALKQLVEELKVKYPNVTIHGHKEFAKKDCPCFDVQNEFGK